MLPFSPGCFLPQRSKHRRNPSRLVLMSSMIGWKRSLLPAFSEVIALFMATPPSGSLVISLRGCPEGCGAAAGLPDGSLEGPGDAGGAVSAPGAGGAGVCPLAQEAMTSPSPTKRALAIEQARMRRIV